MNIDGEPVEVVTTGRHDPCVGIRATPIAEAMLAIVLADNLLVLFLGWEGVGTCSYLLISFWFERPTAAAAGKKDEKKVKKFYRPWQVVQDPERCLLEQGIVCAGSVTRSGCGVRCPDSGMPCRGCYGPPPQVKDQGAKFISAVASIVESRDPAEMQRVLDEIPDIMGYAYRFGLPASTLQRSMRSL